MDIRAAINLITKSTLVEIERTGSTGNDQHVPGELDKADLRNDQLDLFREVPTLEPNLPEGWKTVGRIGSYFVINRTDGVYRHYVVVDKDRVAAHITLTKFSRDLMNYPNSGATPPDIAGKGLRVSFVQVRDGYTGQGLAPRLYEWLLTKVCDYLMADEAHTPEGEAMWKRFVRMKDKFAVMIWDPDSYENREIKQARWLDRAYKYYNNLPWMTLRSRVDGLLQESTVERPISEKFVDAFTAMKGNHCEVFKNPSRAEFRQIKAKGDCVRAFLVDEDILVWKAYLAVHQNVREHFRLPKTAIPVIIYGDPGQECAADITDNTRNTPLLHDPHLWIEVTEHPYMLKMFKGVEVSYFDEDIVGDWATIGQEDLDEAAGDRLAPFAGMSRDDFLGKPRITSAANGSSLRPCVLTTVEDVPREPFLDGRYEAAFSPDGAAVFDEGVAIASYNFGDTLVVLPKYRRKGIGSELVYQWRTRNPSAKPASHRTKNSHKLQQKVWDRIQREIETTRPTIAEAYYERYQREEAEHAPILQAVIDYAESLGVQLDVVNQLPQSLRDHTKGAGWAIAWIERKGGEKGAAVKVVERLNAVADEHGQKVALQVMKDDAALIPYYERLGYKLGRREKDGVKMVRLPAKRPSKA